MSLNTKLKMNGLGFENMKVFKEEQWFDFKDITLLTGTNNSGKSSIIKAMQMLQENIKATNIDDLIKTEFKLSSNLNKYGSIANFVNNKASIDNNYFVFIRQIKSVEYKIKVGINPGLESYGSVQEIEAFDLKSNQVVFKLTVNKPYPDYQCTFNINYKYFTDRFYKKCENTEKLLKSIVELDKFCEEVNNKSKTTSEFEEFAKILSIELSVYISVYWLQVENISFCDYSISNFDLLRQFEENFEEIGVFFTKSENKRINDKFISNKDYNTFFKTSLKQGLYDFSFLWNENPEVKTKFENIICSYYKKSFEEANKLLCDDLITFLSNHNWTFEVKNDYKNDRRINQNLNKKFFENLPDFGLFASLLMYEDKTQMLKGRVKDYEIESRISFDKKSEPLMNLLNSTFFKEVYINLADLIQENCFASDDSIYKNATIAESVSDVIRNEIVEKMFELDLQLKSTFVSSSRFTSKRSYNFNDNSDFTNLLKEVEKQKSDQVKNFISKWIKEFGLADKLLLKPDQETDNFKAILRQGDTDTPLADYGLGTNQLLPIILSLAIQSNADSINVEKGITTRTVVIEEPEANLHPALQSKLADMFVDANTKFGVQIIAETHSEYLIRRMQFLVAKNELQQDKQATISIANDKVNIHYINAELDEEARKAYEITFSKNGQLSESFGKGFLDETTTLQFELYKLNNAQFN